MRDKWDTYTTIDPDFDEMEPICGVQMNAWDNANEFSAKKNLQRHYDRMQDRRWEAHHKKVRARAEAYREEQRKKNRPVNKWWWYEWS